MTKINYVITVKCLVLTNAQTLYPRTLVLLSSLNSSDKLEEIKVKTAKVAW